MTYKLNSLGFNLLMYIDTINLVTVNAVNTEVKIPIANVTEKPFTGPDPIKTIYLLQLKL